MMQTAALMSKLNKEEIPLSRIELLGDFPICVLKDGTTVVALQWDYAAWTPGAAHVSDEVEKFAAKISEEQACTGCSFRAGFFARNWKRAANW
jgi:hypothetical protein